MAINKVMDSIGNLLIDLTNDTVTPDKVAQGYTFHDRSGNVQTGTAVQDLHGIPNEDWVMFFDYDGTLVETWTYEELQQANALPSGPDHTSENLTFDGWNYTIADLLAQVSPIVVGACYKATDGLTHIKIKATFYLNFNLYVNSNKAEYTIDWGDGTTNTVTTLNTGTSNNTAHTYASQGTYDITISSTDTYKLGYNSWTNCVIGANSSQPYRAMEIEEVQLSEKVSGLKTHCFYNAYNLKKIAIPSTLLDIGGNQIYYSRVSAFVYPRGLMMANAVGTSYMQVYMKVISIPNTVTDIVNSFTNNEYNLEYFSIPISVINYGSYLFSNLRALKTPITIKYPVSYMLNATTAPFKLTVLNWDITYARANMFYNYYIYKGDIVATGNYTDTVLFNSIHLTGTLKLPSTLVTINYGVSGVGVLDISSCETIPTLTNLQNIFSGGICPSKIIIGYGMMSQYAAATNWSTLYSYGLLEEATE